MLLARVAHEVLFDSHANLSRNARIAPWSKQDGESATCALKGDRIAWATRTEADTSGADIDTRHWSLGHSGLATQMQIMARSLQIQILGLLGQLDSVGLYGPSLSQRHASTQHMARQSLHARASLAESQSIGNMLSHRADSPARRACQKVARAGFPLRRAWRRQSQGMDKRTQSAESAGRVLTGAFAGLWREWCMCPQARAVGQCVGMVLRCRALVVRFSACAGEDF